MAGDFSQEETEITEGVRDDSNGLAYVLLWDKILASHEELVELLNKRFDHGLHG